MSVKKINYSKLLLCICLIFFGFTFSLSAQNRDISRLITKDSINKLLQDRKMRNIDTIVSILSFSKDNLTPFSRYKLYYELGRLYRKKSDFVKAVNNHKIAQMIAEELKDTVSIIEASNQLGTDFRRVESLADASKAHFYALKLAENYSKKDTKEGKKLLSFSLNGIGNIYKVLNNKKEAIVFFKRSVAIDKELENNLGLAINHVTIGSVFEHQNLPDLAYEYYMKAMHYDSLANSKTGIAICHNRIGQLMIRQNKWDKALEHYQKANKILYDKNDVWNRLKTETDIAWIYIHQKKYNQAYQLLKKTEKTATERRTFGYLEKTHYMLGVLHFKQNQYKKASESYRLSLDYRDSIQRVNKVQKALDIRVDFERERSKQHIQNLNRINEQEKNKRQIIVVTGTIIFVLLTGLLLVSYHLFRTQRKRNTILRETNMVRDKIFSIISHDLKAPAIAQKMAIQNLKPQVEALDNEMIKRYCRVLQENTENQVNVIENLMNWARVQTNKIRYTPQAVDIIPIISEEIRLYEVATQQKQVKTHINIPKSCIVIVDKQMISIVIRNLINNAVKFTPPNGNITISCIRNENDCVFSVLDDGIGMSSKQISALYSQQQKVEVRFGTKGEKGTGLGLILCKDLLQQNNSRLMIKSKENKGTEMFFSLKLAKGL